MVRTRGFTLIELMIVVAVAGILAVVAGSTIRSGTRNANLSSAAYEFAIRLGGLRATAMSEGKDYLIVFVDAPSSDASACRWSNTAACTRYYILANPAPAWSLGSFDPAHPWANAEAVDDARFPRGVHLDLTRTFTAPAPFSALTVHDPDLQTVRGSSQTCFAIRFTRLGTVVPEYAGASKPAKVGYGFVLGTDLSGAGLDRRGVSIAFPSGIVKTVTL